MTPAQLRAMLDAATKRPWWRDGQSLSIKDNEVRVGTVCVVSGGTMNEGAQSDATAIVATMNAADALVALWAALRSTGYTYRPDSEDPVERRIADALRRLEELNP